MKLLINDDELKQIKCRSLVPLECEICKSIFYKPKNLVLRGLKGTRKVSLCSRECHKKLLHSRKKEKQKIEIICEYCKKPFQRDVYLYNKWNVKKNKKCFCSNRCVSSWQAKRGANYTRSKLEQWIKTNLRQIYPTLPIKYNDREFLNGLELDIYIPSLNLSFELNGIYHYEPIYGELRLKKRQDIDEMKFKRCIEKNISLCIIDVSKVGRLKPERDKQYLDIITSLIDENLERVPDNA